MSLERIFSLIQLEPIFCHRHFLCNFQTFTGWPTFRGSKLSKEPLNYNTFGPPHTLLVKGHNINSNTLCVRPGERGELVVQ